MMVLRKVSETATDITIGWTKVVGAEAYRGTRKGYLNANGTQRWTQTSPDATSMKFAKDEWYKIEALRRRGGRLKTFDSGTYTATAPPPPPPPTGAVYPSTTRYPSETP